MPEFLDMGKYSVYVWSSVALFFALITWDMWSLRRKRRQLCQQLLSLQRRGRNRRPRQRNRPTA